MSSLDDRIRSVLDRIRVTLIGQLEADLTASTADILRAVSDQQRQAITAAEQRAAGEARLDAERRITVVRSDCDREKELLRHGPTAEIDGLERTLGDVRDELEVMRHSLDEVQNARDELGRELEQVKRSAEESRKQVEGIRLRLERSARLSSAFRTLNDATSLVEILDRLAEAARRESARTAVFLVRDGKLRGWRTFGFEGTHGTHSIVGAELDSQAPTVVGEAARLGKAQQHRNGLAAALPAFAMDQASRDAVALPVQVGGTVIAVLYADMAATDTPDVPEWLEEMKALATHAGRVLEAMTVNQAAALWAPRGQANRSSYRGGERLSGRRE